MSLQSKALKNGTTEAAPLVAVVMLHLERLFAERPIHAYELVEICRDPAHVPFGNTGRELEQLSLLRRGPENSYFVDNSTRNVVLSAVSGDGVDLRLGNPLAVAS